MRTLAPCFLVDNQALSTGETIITSLVAQGIAGPEEGGASPIASLMTCASSGLEMHTSARPLMPGQPPHPTLPPRFGKVKWAPSKS